MFSVLWRETGNKILHCCTVHHITFIDFVHAFVKSETGVMQIIAGKRLGC